MTKKPSFEKGAEAAAAGANQELDETSERFQPPTWDNVRQMLPEPQDQEQLQRLMGIVQADTAHNEKVAALLHNINGLAGTVVKVLGHFR